MDVRSIQKHNYSIMLYTLTLDLEPGKNGFYIYMTTVSMYETVREQYLLFDFADILSAVGGGLGLFLGVSFFSVFSSTVSLLLKSSKTRKSKSISVQFPI